MEILGNLQGGLWGFLAELGEVPGGTKNEKCSRGTSWDGPGKPSGGFLTYWAILGSVLKVKLLLFHWFEIIFQDVLLFDGFS